VESLRSPRTSTRDDYVGLPSVEMSTKFETRRDSRSIVKRMPLFVNDDYFHIISLRNSDIYETENARTAWNTNENE